MVQRISEIGLRRSLGARPRHIAGQVLTEAALLGVLGGIIGASAGLLAVVGTALGRGWDPSSNPATVLGAPLVGLVTGLAAGRYPAARAARIEPVEALRW